MSITYPVCLWDPSDLVASLGPAIGSLGDSLWDPLWYPLWDSSGIHETCVGPHVTCDTHDVGLVAHGWLDCLVFSLV